MALNADRADALFNAHLSDARRGNADAYFELGIAFSTGTNGCDIDLIAAHKWFNLAALAGVTEGHLLRAEVAMDMAREDIAQAQREARAWIDSLRGATIAATTERRAA
jgi:uncharacterized protein